MTCGLDKMRGEVFEDYISYTQVVNSTGHVTATVCNSGAVCIYDFEIEGDRARAARLLMIRIGPQRVGGIELLVA